MMTCRIVFITTLLLSGVSIGLQAAEMPLDNTAHQACAEHAAFNNRTDAHNLIADPEVASQQSSTHCLTSIQTSNNNKLFGNNDLFR
ncbi:MAG: hypothetical protein P4L95_07065 [Rouxiella aceris]|uniref:hypothetical protein n=1 Tax=Rouxiella aceris TaxID=2703884 RepID=UPI002850142D|nr:hypothetical protein [Rouxiella aceris]MDR3431654.1 hypothetical protein [Rouxiella aceris]